MRNWWAHLEPTLLFGFRRRFGFQKLFRFLRFRDQRVQFIVGILMDVIATLLTSYSAVTMPTNVAASVISQSVSSLKLCGSRSFWWASMKWAQATGRAADTEFTRHHARIGHFTMRSAGMIAVGCGLVLQWHWALRAGVSAGAAAKYARR
jgi:hypothetical protein